MMGPAALQEKRQVGMGEDSSSLLLAVSISSLIPSADLDARILGQGMGFIADAVVRSSGNALHNGPLPLPGAQRAFP